MTISMDPHYTTVKLPEGGLMGAKSGIEFHFHGPVTLNVVMPAPDDRGMWEEGEGGEDVQQQRPDDAAGPAVLSPLMCDTRALPATHPRNGGMWQMKDHPYYATARRAAAELEAAEREPQDEPEQDNAAKIEPAVDDRSRWHRLLRRPAPAVAE